MLAVDKFDVGASFKSIVLEPYIHIDKPFNNYLILPFTVPSSRALLNPSSIKSAFISKSMTLRGTVVIYYFYCLSQQS